MSKDRPILFSAPMVRAILAGTKVQTRRPLRVQPPVNAGMVSTWHHPNPRPMYFAWVPTPNGDGGAEISDWPPVPCPFGMPGDRLWVREAHTFRPRLPNMRKWSHTPEEARVVYGADDVWLSGPYGPHKPKMRQSIHMPRWASRITLEITGVRVERLQGISRGDAMSEGCPFPNMANGDDPRKWYADLWDQINGPGAWDANPWVWVIGFKRAPAA